MTGTPQTIRDHNRDAWGAQVRDRNPWTIPCSPEVIENALAGTWHIVLTPTIPVPPSWFPPLQGLEVLCLASGGGQQGPVLAAAGARVTVLDNCPAQLEQDRIVAKRHDLRIETLEADMADLSSLADGSFDLIVHPVSNTFVPSVRPVWKEAFRVLRPGGGMLSGVGNPVLYLFSDEAFDSGELTVSQSVPYSDLESLSTGQIEENSRKGEPLQFGHTLEDQIGGQVDAGFHLTGFYEDRFPDDPISRYTATYIATRALKPRD